MDPAQTLVNEEKRLSSLYSLKILDTPNEERFDRITFLAIRIFGTPYAGIGFIDKSRVWFKSMQHFDLKEISRDKSFEKHVIENGEVFILEDAHDNPMFQNNPLVLGGPKFRFYAGVPLVMNAEKVGVLFIADRFPRKLTGVESVTFKDVSAWVEVEMLKNVVNYQNTQTLTEIQEQLTTRNRQLEEEKAKHDAMIENIGEGVIGINDKGEIIFTNKSVENMTGFSQSELMGKPIWTSLKMVDKFDKEVEVNETPVRNALYLNKKIATSDYFYVRRDNTKFPVAMTATPIVVFEQVLGGAVVFRDITKEKEVDRMKTEFISLASHQLRTPLSAMKWFCEIILDGDVGSINEEQKEVLNNIYHSNERMISLVNTLLNISRIESGRLIIDPEPTDLKKLINEVILELRPRLDKKKHHLAISVHENLPAINIDPKLVRHVYMNLLTNAIKYTPEGGEVVVMVSRSGREIVSQISDSGYGIPKNQAEQVFKKFFRAENIVKVETEGTGLGLYLTKTIVESSGGRIWFESSEGKGTTFWFTLPISGSVEKKGEVSLDT
ncbi:hypothetical protein A3A75_03375 [Candidatus Woesebacteria bacterium RIFCSPLOWO2_01_FULL_39_10]|uniref:histidine kinase n=1 Tax=Candidatus Woesebacteria bacterium RIFCSPLOWO2_01_FULL_39_10 TaxID=1802516 RepID=A0A1F8B5Q4_9BACT|nr:MAG: hypothetical protein A3A75_03375 [Candidatus Woesebacteria bacterium RIFCSPLOWO2_01_FULL_39_10]